MIWSREVINFHIYVTRQCDLDAMSFYVCLVAVAFSPWSPLLRCRIEATTWYAEALWMTSDHRVVRVLAYKLDHCQTTVGTVHSAMSHPKSTASYFVTCRLSPGPESSILPYPR